MSSKETLEIFIYLDQHGELQMDSDRYVALPEGSDHLPAEALEMTSIQRSAKAKARILKKGGTVVGSFLADPNFNFMVIASPWQILAHGPQVGLVHGLSQAHAASVEDAVAAELEKLEAQHEAN